MFPDFKNAVANFFTAGLEIKPALSWAKNVLKKTITHMTDEE